MGLFERLKKNSQPQKTGAASQTSSNDYKEMFSRSYTNMNSFRGTRKLHITVYDINEGEANANCMKLLKDKDNYGCTGRTIQLNGFTTYNGTGIKVYVDAMLVGIVWDGYNDYSIYQAVFNDNIEGIYVRIEREFVYDHDKESFSERGSAALFVKLQQ